MRVWSKETGVGGMGSEKENFRSLVARGTGEVMLHIRTGLFIDRFINSRIICYL
jgi:hypothetical protein